MNSEKRSEEKDLHSSKLEEKDLHSSKLENKEKREFLFGLSCSLLGVGAICFLYPMLDSLSPSSDTLLEGATEVDLSEIKMGQTIKISHRGKPIFIKHRTPEEIEKSMNCDISGMKDPEEDHQRTKKSYPQWVVLIGICTHLGCIPIPKEKQLFCPCHGSVYDDLGRIISGPAPENLKIPNYEFISDTKIRIT